MLENLDNGNPLAETRAGDVPSAIEVFAYYAGRADKIGGETIPQSESFFYTRREPHGVCGQIIPWNFPILMAAWKLAPALFTGNTVVLKPSSLTSLTVLELTRLLEQTDLPPGVVNVVTGLGSEARKGAGRPSAG